MNIGKYLDPGSQLVMLLTFVLFVAALFLKGLSHDLLLEAGVFLVSVKLIIMSYKNAVTARHLEEQLGAVLSLLQSRNAPPDPDRQPGPS